MLNKSQINMYVWCSYYERIESFYTGYVRDDSFPDVNVPSRSFCLLESNTISNYSNCIWEDLEVLEKIHKQRRLNGYC